VISRTAVREFLNRRDLADSRKAKRYSDKKLDAKLARLDPPLRPSPLPPRTHQKICLLLGAKYPGYAFWLDMGAGKALPDDELVWTPTGLVEMGSLRVGDYVIGSSGRAVRVTGVFPQGVRPVFRIRLSDGIEVRSTDDHLWATRSPIDKKRGKPFRVRSLDVIREKLVDSNGNRMHHLPMVAPVVFNDQPDVLCIDPYVLGVILGDGCVSSSATPVVTLGARKAAVREELSRRGVVWGASHGISSSILGVSKEIRSLGLNGVHSRDKFIPKKYLYASPKNRVLILQGILDTDGDISRGVGWLTASEQLYKDVEFLVQSLGGVARRQKVKYVKLPGWKCARPYYRMSINLPQGISPFLANKTKLAVLSGRKRKYYPTHAISTISPAGVSFCTCICVDAPDGLFVTRGFVLTHNTSISLNLVRWHIDRGSFNRALVLVPYGTQVPEWAEREAPKHRPDLAAIGVDGSPAERRSIFWESDAEMVVITYAGYLSMVCDRIKGKMVPSAERLEEAAQRFGCLVLDEAHAIKNHQSLTFKCLRKQVEIGRPHVYELTGTPFGDEPHDLWSQLYLIDQGESLGPTLGLFRAAFFSTVRNYWGGFEYHFKKALTPNLNRLLAHRTIKYTSEEMVDLPPITGGLVSGGDLLIRRASLPASTAAFYEQAMDELRAAKGDFRDTENSWNRLRRLSSGYALPKDDEGTEQPLIFPSNPKLDLLLELLSSIPLGRQVMVFCFYKFTGQLLADALRKEKYRVGRVYGGQSNRAKNKAVADFIDGRLHILVASDAAAYGLNLQAGNYAIFFESPPSPIKRRQMEKRLWRHGQEFHVFIYDLVIRGTVDEKLLDALMNGRDLFDAVIKGKQDV